MLTGFTGVWNGTSTSSVNAAKVKISFDMNRDGNNLKGSYRCAPFNATCRNNIQNGWVHGQTSARGFAVSMEDSSWCTFVLDDFYPPAGDGEYTCYTNGGIADIYVVFARTGEGAGAKGLSAFLVPADVSGFSVADIYAVMFSRWSIGKEWRAANLPKLLDLTKRLSERPKIAPVWKRHFGK